MYKNIEIVVARYNEDLKWIQEFPFNQFRYTIYNKGENDNYTKPNKYRIIKLPNVGRCDHTYLYHIVNNFNNIAPITIFLPGSIQIPHKKDMAVKLLNFILISKTAVFLGSNTSNVKHTFNNFSLDNWAASDPQNKTLNNESVLEKAKLRPYGKWYNYFFGNMVVKQFCLYGIFSINKLDIIKNNINFYRQFLNSLEGNSNPEVGHYIERSWGVIFHPLIATKFIHSASSIPNKDKDMGLKLGIKI